MKLRTKYSCTDLQNYSESDRVSADSMQQGSARGQRGLEAKSFGLGLGVSGLVLVLMQYWLRSREVCPRGLEINQNCCLHYNVLLKLTFE